MALVRTESRLAWEAEYRKKNKARLAENQKRYRQRVSKKYRAYLKGWRDRNSDHCSNYERRYRQDHADDIRKWQLEWRLNNPTYHRAWRAYHPDLLLQYALKYANKHPHKSLFPSMVPLNDQAILDHNAITPFEMLCLKEENDQH